MDAEAERGKNATKVTRVSPPTPRARTFTPFATGPAAGFCPELAEGTAELPYATEPPSCSPTGGVEALSAGILPAAPPMNSFGQIQFSTGVVMKVVTSAMMTIIENSA